MYGEPVNLWKLDQLCFMEQVGLSLVLCLPHKAVTSNVLFTLSVSGSLVVKQPTECS